MEYGYHFDSGLLGQYLAEPAVARGVTHSKARIVDVNKTGKDDIAALITDSGEQIEADFFIDCSGFAPVIM